MSHKGKRHRKAAQKKLANVKEIKCLNSPQVCQFLRNSNSSGPILRKSMLTGKDFKSFHGWLILEQTGTLYPRYSEWGLLLLEWTKIMLSLTQGAGCRVGGGGGVVKCLQARSESQSEETDYNLKHSEEVTVGHFQIWMGSKLPKWQGLKFFSRSPPLFLVPKQFYPISCAFPSCGFYKKQRV